MMWEKDQQRGFPMSFAGVCAVVSYPKTVSNGQVPLSVAFSPHMKIVEGQMDKLHAACIEEGIAVASDVSGKRTPYYLVDAASPREVLASAERLMAIVRQQFAGRVITVPDSEPDTRH